MTPELYNAMQQWLDSGDDHHRRHAAYRLSLPDAIDFAQKHQYPSLREQIGNAATAFGRAVMSGFAHVDQHEQDRRMAICHECEFFDATQGRCTKCGCFGTFKSWLATERCPIGKW